MAVYGPGFMSSNNNLAEHVRMCSWAQAMGWTPNEIGDGIIRWDLPYDQMPVLVGENDYVGLRAALTEYAARYHGCPSASFG